MQSVSHSTVEIRAAQAADLPAILGLLAEDKLPQEGLADHIKTALVARQTEQLIGCAALEIYDKAALLRSVAVVPALQNQGIGHRLVESALALAREYNVADIYLLTETASHFFLRLGFGVITRAEVPSAVQQSVEFSTACPESALAMHYQLGA